MISRGRLTWHQKADEKQRKVREACREEAEGLESGVRQTSMAQGKRQMLKVHHFNDAQDYTNEDKAIEAKGWEDDTGANFGDGEDHWLLLETRR